MDPRYRVAGERSNVPAGTIVVETQPRTDAEIDAPAPPRERRRVSMRSAVRELGDSRELLLTFVERDLRVRYRQAFLGAFWAILQPILLMVVFSIVFGRIARVGSEGVPYPVFAYTALVPWGFLSAAVTYGTSSIISNAPMVRKIYLPREIFPLSSVLSALVDFGASAVILVAVLLGYGFGPTLTWLAVPLLLATLGLYATAFTLVASAVTVYFRDTRFGVPTIFQILLYATPVAYPLRRGLSALPPGIRGAYPFLNPLVPIMDGFRRSLVHGEWPAWTPLASAAAVGIVALVLSYRWYKRVDPSFADVI